MKKTRDIQPVGRRRFTPLGTLAPGPEKTINARRIHPRKSSVFPHHNRALFTAGSSAGKIYKENHGDGIRLSIQSP